MVDGVMLQLAAWIKTSAKGTKFMSLSFKPKEGAPQKKPDPFEDEDLPF